MGDRRRTRRYDIVGELGGVADGVLRLRLLNLAPAGALLESAVPLPVASVQQLTLSWRGEEVAATARVCHVSQATSPGGQTVYLVGIEFVSAAPALADQLSRWVVTSGAVAES